MATAHQGQCAIRLCCPRAHSPCLAFRIAATSGCTICCRLWITLTKRLFNTWEVRAAAASSLRTALERAADWRLGTVVSATFYQWLVALRLRQRATTMNAIADAFLARHVIRHCLAHWMSAALEVQQLRPALEWATTEAQGQFAAAVVEAWRVRCQVAASDRVLLQEHADRSMHRLALTSVQRWYQRLDECRSMAAAADAFYLPRERERLLLAALDTWRAAAAAQQQSHTMAPAADAFRQSHLVRPVLLRLVSKAERAIADRARADAFHLALQWRRVRRRFVRPAKAAALALWRTATARRLASKRVMASAVTLYRRTIQQRALDAWREYVTIRRAHSAQMQAAALVATRALVTAVLARWDAAVHESRHARIVDRRVVAWRAEFAKARAWYAWIGVVRRQQARRHQVQLAVQWHQTRMSLAVLATWQHAAARRRWEHEWVAHFVQVRQHQCATVALLQWRRQTLARVTERRAVKHIATVRQRLALCRAWNLWVEFCALQRTFRRREALAAEEWKSKVIRRVVICIKRDIAQRKVGQEVNHWRLQRQAISTWIGAFERRQQEHDRVQVLYTELARRPLFFSYRWPKTLAHDSTCPHRISRAPFVCLAPCRQAVVAQVLAPRSSGAISHATFGPPSAINMASKMYDQAASLEPRAKSGRRVQLQASGLCPQAMA
ncbi:hypothetical protein BC828DRAFT_386606 [Blastocladiella britannica]|nr:hypothetical protein BC828DRAFT_386606 [Blastocladiella britannica]